MLDYARMLNVGFALGAFACAASAQTQSYACAFAGSGLNDAVCGVGYAPDAQYIVKVSAIGTPDRFQWSKNGGPPSAAIAITGASQALADGATIAFAATTGHTLGASWTINAGINSSVGGYKSIQPGGGAVFRSQLDINRDHGADVKDYGAKCDGSTDDTEAIQAALGATPGNGKLTISGPQPCVISHMVYIPATAEGMILESTRLAAGIGLIAKSGVPAFQMLRTYAAQTHVRDLFLNCNSTATNGLVISDSRQSVFDNVVSARCLGDANQINPYATPATTTTSPLPAGSVPGATFTVATAMLDGLTLGGPSCGVILLDYSKSNQEAFQVSRSGNTLTQAAPAKSLYTHSSGGAIQCYGSNNAVILNNLEGVYSGGWGLNMFYGSDNNAITIRDPTMFSNKAGGEILSGSGGRHIGGHLEGNSGPAIQLGDLNGGGPNGTNGRATFGWIIDPVNDLENSLPAYNAVLSICDFRSSTTFQHPGELLFNLGGPYCPADPAGNSTMGTGAGGDANGNPVFTIKTAIGTLVSQPGVGFRFYDASGNLKNTFGPENAGISGQLTFGPNIQIVGNQVNLQAESTVGGIGLNYSGKNNVPVTLYNGAATPEVILSPTGNSSFIGVQARGLAGPANRPACIDAAGNIYAGTNSNGALKCP